MTLTRDDGHQLLFERMNIERRRHFDIFGRAARRRRAGCGDRRKQGGPPAESARRMSRFRAVRSA
jgi:hypothetical protein